MIRIAVIGCGYWGPNYIRIFNELGEARIICCCDLEEKNLLKIKKNYPKIRVETDYHKVARDINIDAVIITTPLNTHYALAKLCLENGKHILVEKPFTSNSQEAQDLIRIANKNKRILMVGHVYEYNPGIIKLKEIIKKGSLGNIYYAYAERLGLGPIRKHANALWDLAVHDISVAFYLLGETPQEVIAVGEYYIQKGIKDIVFVSLKFPSRLIYNFYTSWIAPEKIRRTSVVGSKGMAVFDDVNKSEILKIYKRTINSGLLDSTPAYHDHQLVVSVGDVHVPKVEQSEPLKNQARHFLKCVSKDRRPLSGAEDGLRVVRILEAAERSLRTRKAVKCL